jgi:hypothetical protein
MAAPKQIQQVQALIEEVQSSAESPETKDRTLAMIESNLKALLGFIYTYRGDLRLVMDTPQNESPDSSEPTQ